MFEIGKSYRIKILDGNSYLISTYEVVDFVYPLLKVKTKLSNESIFNVSAPTFSSAELIEHQEDPQVPFLEMPDWAKKA